ncbi:hypothetical protein [Pseudovibrio sp. Tun.PSC04-5.I4]|uniref:hypothetical protein n=1 Tax=Pseudovibrio sp. Tun.PSC04-5.I4 TaxID=1798213 RepID=UPI000887EE68|nr:hypothetical protein [Pseudovibrio sp. Tun.PSC04-5.I4]SDR22364.1 hypothetical protein SAMN04515695_3537 [Pseudovibrio sp. Tun.PSC04-5.I4]
MTAIGLSSFVSVANALPEGGKLAVVEGELKACATSSMGGRLVSWVKQQTTGDAQKGADQGAFRLALNNQYGEKLGERAYTQACRACGHEDGRSHGLTAKQVHVGVSFAEMCMLRDEGSAIRTKALSEDVKRNPINGVVQTADRHPAISVKKEIADTNGSLSEVLAARIDGKYTDQNPYHVERELMARVSTEIAEKFDPFCAEEATSKAWSSELLQHIYSDVLRDSRPVENGSALKIINTQFPMKVAVERFENKVWQYAEQSFLKSLPENVGSAFHELEQQLDWDNFPDLAQSFGVSGVGWDDETTAPYFSANISSIRDLAMERLLEKRNDQEFLSTMTSESFNDLIEDVLEGLKSPQPKHASPTAEKHDKTETRHVHWV